MSKRSIKGLLKSKVFWFNAITGIVEIANLFVGMMPPGSMTVISVIGNVALRFATNTALSDKV